MLIPWTEYPDLEIPQRRGGYLDWRVVPYRRTVTILALAVLILYWIKEGKWLFGVKALVMLFLLLISQSSIVVIR